MIAEGTSVGQPLNVMTSGDRFTLYLPQNHLRDMFTEFTKAFLYLLSRPMSTVTVSIIPLAIIPSQSDGSYNILPEVPLTLSKPGTSGVNFGPLVEHIRNLVPSHRTTGIYLISHPDIYTAEEYSKHAIHLCQLGSVLDTKHPPLWPIPVAVSRLKVLGKQGVAIPLVRGPYVVPIAARANLVASLCSLKNAHPHLPFPSQAAPPTEAPPMEVPTLPLPSSRPSTLSDRLDTPARPPNRRAGTSSSVTTTTPQQSATSLVAPSARMPPLAK